MVPVISGTVAGLTVDQGSTINPFTNTSISDANPYVYDTLTIKLLDSDGNASDANGTLQLSGGSANVEFSEESPGVYVLADRTTPSEDTPLTGMNTALPRLTFIPSGAATTTFSLTDLSVDAINNSHTITDSTTTVTAGGAGPALATSVPDVTATVDTSGTASTDVSNITAPADSSNAANTGISTASSASNPPNIHVTGRVGARRIIDLSQGDGHLVIDHPTQFRGTINLGSGDIDLTGLAQADSFSFQNDMLSIFGAGTTLDTLHITGGSDFSVEKTATGISIYTADDTHHSDGTLLPIHT